MHVYVHVHVLDSPLKDGRLVSAKAFLSNAEVNIYR